MTKIDLKKEWAELYSAGEEVGLVTVPPAHYVMVDGHGDPNAGSDYQEAIQALYTVAYTMKFMLKGEPDVPDWVVMPLESLWWAEGAQDFTSIDLASWSWTAMIIQPSLVSEDMVRRAIDEARRKKGETPGLDRVRLAELDEGMSAQVLHLGPYTAEGATVQRLTDWIRDNGYVHNGRHHEIYMSDPRRTKPERLRTIIRQPVRRAN